MVISYAWLEAAVRIRLADITQPTQFREKVGPLTLDLGYHYGAQVEPVDLFLTVSPVQGGHRLDGEFAYRAVLPCSRCLEEARVEGIATFLLDYQPASQAPIPEEEVEVSIEETQILYYDEDGLALDALVSQQLYLEFPEKVLCRPDCRGLCPRCGADLNQGPCSCPPEGDSRWTALGQLQKKS